MMQTLVFETGENYPRRKASGRKVFFLKGVFNNDSLWSMTVEMPEPGFPLSWEVLLVNIKIKRSVAKNVFEGKKGEYLCVAQTRIVNFTGVF